jgi:hypothetical protein
MFIRSRVWNIRCVSTWVSYSHSTTCQVGFGILTLHRFETRNGLVSFVLLLTDHLKEVFLTF